MRSRLALLAVLLVAFAMSILAGPAGAASVGEVTVSNQSPAPASEIDVASTGWQPGAVVSVLMTGAEGVLGRATADARGAAHARVAVPADVIPGRDVLSVVGATSGGFQQQITTVLSVPAPEKPPAPSRPWPLVYLLAALATVLMLVGERSDRRVATMSPA